MAYLGFIIGYLIIFFTPAIGLWQNRMEDIGKKKVDAFIPFFNYFQLLKACKLPWYWVFFLLFPGVQFIMWASLNVTYVRKFGVFGWKDTILAILFPFPIFWKIAKKKEEYRVAEPTNWDVARQVDARTPSDHVALFFALPVIGHAIALPLSLLGFKRKPGKKSMFKEWGDAILFAIIAASVIRTYVFEPYKIPTGSMEKTLLVGDQLFVDKLTFGARLPMTPFSYPVVHNSFAPLLNVRSYVGLQTIPYTRLPGFRDVERNDVVVFNFPQGDSALNDPRMPYGLIGHTYSSMLVNEAFKMAGKNAQEFESNKTYYIDKARNQFVNEGKTFANTVGADYEKGFTEFSGILVRPVDKRENYIKRCVAIAGDVIEVKDKELLVNDKLAWQSPTMQYHYTLKGYPNPGAFGGEWTASEDAWFKKNFGASVSECGFDQNTGEVTIPMSKSQFTESKKQFPTRSGKPQTKIPNKHFLILGTAALEKPVEVAIIEQNSQYMLLHDPVQRGVYNEEINNGTANSYYRIFPNDPQYDWTEDNFGPLRIPKAGDVVELDSKTIAIYRRIIHAYEGHALSERADGIYIDGKKVEKYTIEQNYYWMMGDNRNGSADSRFWGFVPEDHVVGHAAFTWLSVGQEGMFGGGMRWSRMFNGIE